MPEKKKNKQTYTKLTAQQKKTAQEIYRLWLRRYTYEEIASILTEKGRQISDRTVRRYLKLIREHTRSKYEERTLADLLDEETERFREIISTLWSDHAGAKSGSNARIGAVNAIVNAETRLMEMQGVVMNRLKVDADVRDKVTGYLDFDLGEETTNELYEIVEKIIIAGQEGAGGGAGAEGDTRGPGSLDGG
jgi:hypothetical protein